MRRETLHILSDLEKVAQDHDQHTAEKKEQLLIVGSDSGRFLYTLLQASRYQHVLELGTASGYSTVWLAEAMRERLGRVITLERHPQKHEMAKALFEKADLNSYVDARLVEISDFIAEFDEPQDVIFLDAVRTYYLDWWNDVDRLLRPGGLLIVDNSLKPSPEELVPFFHVVRETNRYFESLLPVGKGVTLFYKYE